jgi:hypothetical protein
LRERRDDIAKLLHYVFYGHIYSSSYSTQKPLQAAGNLTQEIKQSGNWWIGWIEEVQGVNCQEATREELLESLRITLLEFLEIVDDDYIIER